MRTRRAVAVRARTCVVRFGYVYIHCLQPYTPLLAVGDARVRAWPSQRVPLVPAVARARASTRRHRHTSGSDTMPGRTWPRRAHATASLALRTRGSICHASDSDSDTLHCLELRSTRLKPRRSPDDRARELACQLQCVQLPRPVRPRLGLPHCTMHTRGRGGDASGSANASASGASCASCVQSQCTPACQWQWAIAIQRAAHVPPP